MELELLESSFTPMKLRLPCVVGTSSLQDCSEWTIRMETQDASTLKYEMAIPVAGRVTRRYPNHVARAATLTSREQLKGAVDRIHRDNHNEQLRPRRVLALFC